MYFELYARVDFYLIWRTEDIVSRSRRCSHYAVKDLHDKTNIRNAQFKNMNNTLYVPVTVILSERRTCVSCYRDGVCGRFDYPVWH